MITCVGLLSEPKWGHLKDLHAAIRLCEPALVAADSPHYIKLGPKQEVCETVAPIISTFLSLLISSVTLITCSINSADDI